MAVEIRQISTHSFSTYLPQDLVHGIGRMLLEYTNVFFCFVLLLMRNMFFRCLMCSKKYKK